MTVVQLQKQSKAPSFIAPTDAAAERLAGYRAYVAGAALNPMWTQAKRAGWHQANRAEAWAEASEYLVAQGVLA